MSEEIIQNIKEAISRVMDPHIGVSIMEMGLVEDIEYDDDSQIAKITIKPTNPGCMSAARMAMDARTQAESVEAVSKAEITINGHMMADAINEMVNK